jgi:hypothetical protein
MAMKFNNLQDIGGAEVTAVKDANRRRGANKYN